MVLDSDLGDVDPCISYRRSAADSVRGWHAGEEGLSRAARRFLHYLPTLAGSQARKKWKLVKTLLVLFPGLGDAFDKNHGFEASSAHDGEAVHTDLQHVSDEVLEHETATLDAVCVALSDGQEERTSDFRTCVLGGYGTLAATASACDAIQS